MIQMNRSQLKLIPPSQTPLEHCAWCWKVANPLADFPVGISSTICAGHQDYLLKQIHARRAKRSEVH